MINAQVAVSGSFGEVSAGLPADPATLIQALADGLDMLQNAVPDDPAGLAAPVAAALAALAGAFPQGDVPAIGAFADALGQARTVLEPAIELLGSGETAKSIGQLVLEKAGDPQAFINDLLGQLSQLIPAESVAVLETFVSTLQDFEAGLPIGGPQAVANFLAQSFLGVPLDLLAEPLSLIDSFQAEIESLVDPARLAGFTGRIEVTANLMLSATAQISNLDPADPVSFAAAVNALLAVQASLNGLRQDVMQLAADFQTGLAALAPGSLVVGLQHFLEGFPEVSVAQVDAFVDLVLEPIHQINAQLDQLTAADVAQMLDAVSALFQADIAAQGYDEIKAQLLKPFNDIGAAINDLGLDEFRVDIENFLNDIGAAIGNATGAVQDLKDGLQEACDEIEAALGTADTAGDTVETAINDVRAAVESALAAVPLADFAGQVQALFTQLQSVLASFTAALGAALDQVRAFVGQLESLDLRQVAEPVIQFIRDIQAQLEAVDLSLLAEAEAGAFHVSVSVLVDIDLSPVRQAILEGFDAADPSFLLDGALDKSRELVARLEAYEPVAILEPLAEPFAQMTATLERFNPAVLLDPIITQLRHLKGEIEGIKGAVAMALAPLDQPFVAVQQALAAVAPSQLLTPLVDLYDELVALFGRLDINPFLDELETLFGQWLEQGLTGMQGAADGFSGAADLKTYLDGISSGPAGPEYGYMPGDVLRPVASVYKKIMALVDQVPDDVLQDALEQLRAQLVEALATIAPTGLPARIAGALAQQRAAFDVLNDVDLVSSLYTAYSELVLAFDAFDEVRLSASVQTEYGQMASLVVAVNPAPLFDDLRPVLQAVHHHNVGFAGSLDTSALVPLFGPVHDQINALIPAFLIEPLDVAGLKAALEALNPEHLAAEVNQAFEALLLKISDFGDTLIANLPELVTTLQTGTTAFMPSLFREAFNAVYGPLQSQLDALNPVTIIASLEANTYTPLVSALDDLKPSGLLADVNLGVKLSALATTLQAITDALQALRADISFQWQATLQGVAALDPANLQASLDATFGQVQVDVASDLTEILDTVEQAIERLRADLVRALDDVERALEEMLAAVPA